MRINPIILILLVSLSLNGLVGYLSYKFYSDKSVVEAALISCQESNVSLEKQIEKQQKEKEATDVLISEYQQKQQEIHKKQCESVNAISRLPSKPTKREEVNDPSNEVDIDGKLPRDLVRLLRTHHNSVQGQIGGDATKPTDKPL